MLLKRLSYTARIPATTNTGLQSENSIRPLRPLRPKNNHESITGNAKDSFGPAEEETNTQASKQPKPTGDWLGSRHRIVSINPAAKIECLLCALCFPDRGTPPPLMLSRYVVRTTGSFCRLSTRLLFCIRGTGERHPKVEEDEASGAQNDAIPPRRTFPHGPMGRQSGMGFMTLPGGFRIAFFLGGGLGLLSAQ